MFGSNLKFGVTFLKRKQTIHRHHHQHRRKKIWKYLIGFLILFFAFDAFAVYKLYHDARQAADSTYQGVKHKSTRNGNAVIQQKKPFSLLIMGTDTGEYGRTYRGRTDTIMVAVVNPVTKTTTLASIPRDTKVAIPGHGFDNKINAAYSYGGTSLAMNTVQSYLGIPIDHYIEMNMKGLVQLSAAVGPVTVNNDLDFTNLGYHFKKGKVTINKDNVLAYTRMRYQDPRGDYGRQLRQRLVITELVKKGMKINNLLKYRSILDAISSNMRTDLTFDQMKILATDYRKAGTIKQLQLQGNGQQIGGVDYEVVPQANLDQLTQKLKNALEIK
ncbi:LCP family protein [Liquorilactobacillus ghanensis]|jgi:LCP family protein required for cell wall assembly|uniref:LCP family glycopolymer transferase n=1 Tax=Liquorilactobacillus ghanensis TaxID=399370 RepID=UPI0039EBBD0C